MRRTEKIVNIRSSDIDEIRSDFESEGAKVEIEEDAGRYTAVAKFPIPLRIRIAIASLILVIGFVTWNVWNVGQIFYFRHELSSFHLPPDLYERQEQLESLSIHQNQVASLNWLHSRQLTELSIASSKLDSVDGLAKVDQLRSLDLDFNGAPLKFLDDVSALHRLNTLILRNAGRRKTALIPDLRAFSQVTKFYLDFNHSSANSGPDFSRCPELPRAQEDSVALEPGRLQEPSPSPAVSPSSRPSGNLVACQELRDLTLNFRATTGIAAVPDLSRLTNLRTASVLVDLSGVRSLKSLASIDVRDLTLSVDGTQLPMLSDLNANQSVRSLTLAITSPLNSSLPNLSGMHGLLSLRLDMPGARGRALSDNTQIPDITYLKRLQQLTIVLNGSDATALPPIGEFQDLHGLTLELQSSGVGKLPDLSSLRHLDRLDLNVSNTNIRELPNFAAWRELSSLSVRLAHSQVNSLAGIENLSLLQSLTLDIEGASVHDLSRILKLANLKRLILYLGWEQIHDLPDITLLKGLTSLEIHVIGLPSTEQLPQLAGLSALEELTLDLKKAHMTTLPDLSFMSRLRKITVDLEDSDIQDLSTLEKLGSLEDLNLNLRGTHIKILPNLQPLGNLQSVTADISHSTVQLQQTDRLSKLQGLTVNTGLASLRDLPKSVKRLNFVQ
jgi:hypothetical protein